MAAFALFFKLRTGNIDNDILKVINENDLSFYPSVAEHGSQRIFFNVLHIGYANILNRLSVSQLVYRLGHYLSAVERVFNNCFI